MVLADAISHWRQQNQGTPGQVRVVLAMMADKDHREYVSCLENQVDFWYIGDLEMPRCMKAGELSDKLSSALNTIVPPVAGSDVSDRFGQALSDAGAEDLIVV